MKEVISSIISFFCTIIIVGVDNMEKVPSMISTKDLDYLTRAWLYNYERAGAQAIDERIYWANGYLII